MSILYFQSFAFQNNLGFASVEVMHRSDGVTVMRSLPDV